MSKYKCVWNDEFTSEGKPSLDKWRFECGGHGWGNRESQCYTDRIENAYVKDGKLHIQAMKEGYNGNNYTSARLTTYGIESWQYAKIDVCAKLPKGRGTWPAIWMLPDSIHQGMPWPLCGEIDIMEHVGFDQDRIHFSLHTGNHNHLKKTQLTSHHLFTKVSEEFNIYSIEWTKESIKFLFNQVEYAHFKKPKNHTKEDWPFDQPFHLVLNVALGGFWGGEIDDTMLPQEMVIDYVRVYQLE